MTEITERREEYGKDEMNLAEFPITLISNRHRGDEKTLEYSDTITVDGKDKKREWIVTGSDKFGLPLAQDNDVLLALLYLGKKYNFRNRKINFSRFKLCKIMRIKPQGDQYKRIEAALDRLMGVHIKAINVFWDNDLKEATTVSFGIVDDYKLCSERRTKSSETSLSFVNLNEPFYKSIVSGYIKSLDLNLYFSLNSPVSKRLYRYLDKKRYGKNKFEIDIFLLSDAHIGLSRNRYPSQIKERLDPAHQELIEAGFLKSVEYKMAGDGISEKVVYIFADKNDQIEKQNPAPQLDNGNSISSGVSNDNSSEIFKKLVELGVTENVAREVVEKYSDKKIKAQIEALPFRGAKEPAALLIRSIQEDWAPTAEHKNHIESKKQAAADKAKKKEEDRREAERRRKIEDYLDNLSEEEKKALNDEALKRAMQDGGSIVRKFGVHEGMFEAYVSMVVEEKLGISVG